MRQMQLSEAAKKLIEAYPDAESFFCAIGSMHTDDREKVVRLWLSEGIPYAFRDLPMLYEEIRSWLGVRIGIPPKSITIIGSGRIGFSLRPRPSYGRLFGKVSDLDLAAISESLFDSFLADFDKWKGDHVSGLARPKNQSEADYWKANMTEVPKKAIRGFVDANLVPYQYRYPTAQRIGQTLYELKVLLDRTPGSPVVRARNGISIRVYRDWDAFARQMLINFRSMVEKGCTDRNQPPP